MDENGFMGIGSVWWFIQSFWVGLIIGNEFIENNLYSKFKKKLKL